MSSSAAKQARPAKPRPRAPQPTTSSSEVVAQIRTVDRTPRPNRVLISPPVGADEARVLLNRLVGYGGGVATEPADFGWRVADEAPVVVLNLSGAERTRGLPVVHLPWCDVAAPWAATTVADDPNEQGLPLWYTIGGLPDIGTLYIVGTEIQVGVLKARGIRAACLPTSGGWDITASHAAELRKHAGINVVVVADAGEAGLRAGIRRAAALRAIGVNAELRTWAVGTPDGYNVVDDVLAAAHDDDIVLAALETLPSVELPLMPEGGFWWPRGERFQWPAGYVMGPGGVCRIATDRKTGERFLKAVTVMPVWIGKHFHGPDYSDAAVELCALVDGRQVRRVVAMSEISSASKLPALTDYGFLGFTSELAGEVVSYLTAALAANLRTLPRAQTARCVGSEFAGRSNTPRAFVHNGERLLPGGCRDAVELSPSAGVQPRRWELYRTRGDAVEWARVIQIYRAHRFEVPMTALLAGIASVLNRPLGVMPMTIQLAGEAAGGKTTVLQHVMSLMGDPTDLGSMRATDNAMEMKLRFSNDLPLLVDEVQSYAAGPRQEHALEALLYMVSEREGKDRLKRDGSERASSTWSCNMICTGEKDLGELKATGNTGARRRVLSFFGSPFGEVSDRIRTVIHQLADLVAENHGHAMPLVARHLLDLDDANWAALRARHRAVVARYLQEETPRGVNAGLAETAARAFAAFEIAGEILETVFPTAFRTEEGAPDDLPTIRQLLAGPWRETLKRMGAAPRAERSLDALRSYVALRRADFEGADPPLGAHGTGRKAGRFGERGGVQYIAFVREELSGFLSEAGYDYETDRKHWEQRGWVLTDAAGKSTIPVAVNGQKVRCLCVRRDAVELQEEPVAPALIDDDVPF